MSIPLKVTTRTVELTDAIETEVKSRLELLERIYDRIESCHVSMDGPVQHHRKGGPFTIKIDLAVPGPDVVVTRKAEGDLYAAIRTGFDAARRRLEEHLDRRRQFVKARA